MAVIQNHLSQLNWEYTQISGYDGVLCQKCNEILLALSVSNSIDVKTLCDTRPVHKDFFLSLTPAGFDLYAGTYRSDLKMNVRFGSHYGVSHQDVMDEMDKLATKIKTGIKMLERYLNSFSAELKLYNLAGFAASVTSDFIKIHPYLNGNGHISRFLVCSILMPYSYVPVGWTIHQRPNTNDYISAMDSSLKGNNKELTDIIIDVFKFPT